MALLNYILPILSITGGAYLLMYPPKNRNSFFAFKTQLARLSKETWIFAQKRCGVLLVILGITLFLLTMLFQHFLGNCVSKKFVLTFLLILLQAIIIFSSLALVDFEIADSFDEKGKTLAV